MRVVVLGSEGYAGRHVLQALAESGVPGTDAPDLRGVDVVINCLPTLDPLRRQPRHFSPDPSLVALTGRMALAGVGRLVHLSTSTVLGADARPARGGTRILETAEPRPVHAYERLRLREERWLREAAGVDLVVVRPAPGVGAHEPVLARLLVDLERGRLRLPMGGRAQRSFLAGSDLGRVVVAAALRGRAGATYLATGFDGSWRDLMEMSGSLLGIPARIGSIPYDLAYLAAYGRQLGTPAGAECWPSPYLVDLMSKPQLVDDGLTRRDLSWSPQVGSFQEGVADVARWWLAEKGRADPAVAPEP